MSSIKPKKKRKKPVALFLGIVILFGFLPFSICMYLMQNMERNSQTQRECAIRSWQWMKALNHIEFRLKRWEQMAPFCLKSGFIPLTQDESGTKFKLWSVESVAAVTGGIGENVAFAPEGAFITNPDLWVCTPHEVVSTRIKRMATNTVMVINHEHTNLPPTLRKGTQLISTKAIDLEVAPRSGVQGEFTLLESSVKSSYLPVAHGIEKFTIVPTVDAATEKLTVEIDIEKGACKVHKNVELNFHTEKEPGYWAVRKDDMVFVALTKMEETAP